MTVRRSAFSVTTETETGNPLAWLLNALLTGMEWQAEARCAAYDPEGWFPATSSGRRPEQRMARVSAGAKAVCAQCPVRTECLEFALESDSRYGVWSGLDEYERRALRAPIDRRLKATS